MKKFVVFEWIVIWVEEGGVAGVKTSDCVVRDALEQIVGCVVELVDVVLVTARLLLLLLLVAVPGTNETLDLLLGTLVLVVFAFATVARGKNVLDHEGPMRFAHARGTRPVLFGVTTRLVEGDSIEFGAQLFTLMTDGQLVQRQLIARIDDRRRSGRNTGTSTHGTSLVGGCVEEVSHGWVGGCVAWGVSEWWE